MAGPLTILIAARDGAATIERAVGSCLDEIDCPIILIDDHSRDDTVARARAVAGPRLRVEYAPAAGGVAVARQRGLEAVETPYAAWLDADDEWIAGRAARLLSRLEHDCDVAVEAIDLIDGLSGEWLRRLRVPDFLRHGAAAVRLFERNFLPGDTQVGFRVEVFRRAGGYDAALFGPESFDLLLRAVRGGARLGCGDDVGYRMYAYPNSVSRDVDRQRAALAVALRKHRYEDVRRLYATAGYCSRIAAWALVLLAQFRNEPSAALQFLDEASPADADPSEILEPDGPWPIGEGWRRAFHRGTIMLALGRYDEAVTDLLAADVMVPTAEGANNLGVALHRVGRRRDAAEAFARAATRFPGYLDAQRNARALEPAAVTTHPLRRAASRSEYSLS